MIGFALSSPPGKPKVAFYSGVAPGKGEIGFGSQQINISKYANQLFESIQPIKVNSPDEAIAKVRSGQAQAAVIVPSDIVAQTQDLATQGLGFATPVLGSIGNPLNVQTTELAGKTTPTASYAAAIAIVVSLMFVTILLAAGMLAIERSENAYSRLVRGLVSTGRLLSEKVLLSGGCAAAVTLLMAAFVSLFVHLEWARFPLWLVAL